MIKRDHFTNNTRARNCSVRPSGYDYEAIYMYLLDTPHLLIGGTTGSGKSVAINGIIAGCLNYSDPTEHKFVFIDPKQVELDIYSNLPLWNQGYADTIPEAVTLLEEVSAELDRRMRITKSKGQKMYDGCHLHIVIDEYADLVHNAEYPKLRPVVERYICKIARMGRAARIHLIIATQRATREVLTGELKTNIDYRLCLRMSNAQESRNVLEVRGAEELPRYGFGLLKKPEGIVKVKIPMVSDEYIRASVRWWTDWRRTGAIKVAG